jgi:hypothetical protein
MRYCSCTDTDTDAEVTQRDLEAVAEQAAQELVKKSGSSSGFWPFKEERQLVSQPAPPLARLLSCLVASVQTLPARWACISVGSISPPCS